MIPMAMADSGPKLSIRKTHSTTIPMSCFATNSHSVAVQVVPREVSNGRKDPFAGRGWVSPSSLKALPLKDSVRAILTPGKEITWIPQVPYCTDGTSSSWRRVWWPCPWTPSSTTSPQWTTQTTAFKLMGGSRRPSPCSAP